MRDPLIPLELLDDLLASDNILEQFLQVRCRIRAAVVIGIKVLRFERYVCRSIGVRNTGHPLLVIVLRNPEKVFQFPSVAEVGSIPST